MTRVDIERPAGRSGAPPRRLRALVTTLLLTAPALVIAASPTAASWASYDRARIAAGEVWRVVTGHWAHWTLDHLAWDLLAFVVLVPLCLLVDARGERRTLVALFAASVAIPLAVWFVLPEIVVYRGLSGLDSALFTLLATSLFLREIRARAWGTAAFFAAALAAFALKVGFELFTGTTVFVETNGFVPVTLAHVIGGASGTLVAWGGKRGHSDLVSNSSHPRGHVVDVHKELETKSECPLLPSRLESRSR